MNKLPASAAIACGQAASAGPSITSKLAPACRRGGRRNSWRAVDAAGKLDAGYANPGPLPFYSAEATRDGTQTRLFFELRAGGYSGSTYRLTYDAAADRLIGLYYQAVARQSYDVQFERAK